MSKLGVALFIFLVLFPLEALQLNGDQSADRRAEERSRVLPELYKNSRRAMERKAWDEEWYERCNAPGCDLHFCCR
nr:TPA_inf: conotoxin precursor M [Conus judaeus]